MGIAGEKAERACGRHCCVERVGVADIPEGSCWGTGVKNVAAQTFVAKRLS